jgi:hypothetical protein
MGAPFTVAFSRLNNAIYHGYFGSGSGCCVLGDFAIFQNLLKPRFCSQPFQHLTRLSFSSLLVGMNANLVTDAKFAFVIAERKEYKVGGGNEHIRQWTDFLGNVKMYSTPPEGTQKIHENVWLIPLSSGLPFLSQLIDWGGSSGVSIRILFLEEAPNWIKYPPDAKPADETKPS